MIITPIVTLGDNTIDLKAPFDDRHLCKKITGYAWNKDRKCWSYPIHPRVLQEIVGTFPNARVDELVEAACERVRERTDAVAAAKKSGWQNAEPRTPMPVTVQPFQHQILGYNIATSLDHSALLMEMGTGKTLTAIAAAGRRYLDGQIRRVLIVAPSSVVPVWPREFADFADYPVDVRVLSGAVAKRKTMLADWVCPVCDGHGGIVGGHDPNSGATEWLQCQACHETPLEVAVINYEATWRMVEELIAWSPDMVILDESQRIKTPSAAQSKAMHKIGKTARYRMILTGTPVTQHPLDFFSQYKFLDPAIFGTTFTSFRSRYAMLGGFEGREVVGYRHLDELIARAHSIAFRVTKDEALDLPPFLDVERTCELTPGARKIYDSVAEQSIAELETGGEITTHNILTRLLRLQQITGGWVADDDGDVTQVSSAKLDLLGEVLSESWDADPDRKIVVFARFREEIKAIRAHLDELDVESAMIWGDTPMDQRGGEVARFQTSPTCRVFIAQIQTAGLGITLNAADIAVFYSLDFSFANYDQARSRLHRIGQKNNVTNIHLVVPKTVDEAVLRVLQRKRNVADAVVDGDFRDLIRGRDSVHVQDFARVRPARSSYSPSTIQSDHKMRMRTP